MDLCVRVRSSEKDNYLLLKRCIEFGWEAIAWTQTILGKSGTKTTINPRKPMQLTAADVISSSVARELVIDASEPFRFSQYNRLNVIVDDVADAQMLNAGNEQFKAFDILSATPGNGQVLAFLCKSADVDIISIDFSHKVPFSISKKLIDIAVKRGILFEIQYSPTLVASTRSEVFSSTKNVVKFLRGRSIVLTSGAETYQTVRGPSDAMNVAALLQLTGEQARDSVTRNAQAVLDHAAHRKNKYLSVRVLPRASFEENCERLATLGSKDGKRASTADRKRKRGKASKASTWSSSDESGDDQSDEDEDDGTDVASSRGKKRREAGPAVGGGSAQPTAELKDNDSDGGGVEDDDGFLRL